MKNHRNGHNGRKVRKQFGQFLKDHVFGRGWIPRKLRLIRQPTDAEINLLIHIRDLHIEAGRKRMVARGMWQYARPGELTYEQAKRWADEGKNLPDSVREEHGLPPRRIGA